MAARNSGSKAAYSAALSTFRKLVQMAEDRGHDRDVAHASMRLYAHELTRWDVRDVALKAEAAAEGGRTALSAAARVILDRVRASDQLLRNGDPGARALLMAVRDESLERGYRHQVSLIEDTFTQERRRAARTR